MGNSGAYDRHDTGFSQKRALTILCKCIAVSTNGPKYVQTNNHENTIPPRGIKNTESRFSARKGEYSNLQSKNTRIVRSHQPVLHTYILTWL